MPTVITDDRRKMDAMLRRANLLKGATITVGVHGDDGDREGEESNVQIAATHEFGDPQRKPPIPKRSFIRTAIDANRPAIQAEMRNVLDRTLQGKGDVKAMIEEVGVMVVEEIRAPIREGRITPPLSDFTKTRREERSGKPADNARPLLDTGQLIQSIAAYTTIGGSRKKSA